MEPLAPPETVQTGLSGLVAEVKDVEAKLAALAAAPPPAPAQPPEAPAEPITPPIPVPNPVPVPDAPHPAMVISDEPIPVPADAVPVPTAAPTEPIVSPALDAAVVKEAARVAQLEADKQGFYDRIRAARESGKPAPVVTQPVPERIRQQTLEEMEAGRVQVAKNAAQRAIPPMATFVAKRPGLEIPGSMSPVHRPNDYIPDQKKGQGNVTNTVL